MIKANSVVELHYSLADSDGNQIESTRGGNPIMYLHGHDQMLAAFEKAIEGQEAGTVLEVSLSPEQAYGQPKPDATMRIPSKHLQGSKTWKAGMLADVMTENGPRKVRVVKPGRFMVEVDTNHPLAGKSLVFTVQIISVRDATSEELAHGHAHAGGSCGH
ncbi:FKBP-type peptidyl-prolyl cis-trans isomerase [Oceanobacter mangrovi]|uniref:FKBP-type peptidyl-prolyl cis-trans isomerase n=1 Tax=Oceanobacter mangrovi TaxID=2862510 RepID=UPI001C8EB62A|nr:peptidylprolyl isomerase [Oceanobacter mangrovi]